MKQLLDIDFLKIFSYVFSRFTQVPRKDYFLMCFPTSWTSFQKVTSLSQKFSFLVIRDPHLTFWISPKRFSTFSFKFLKSLLLCLHETLQGHSTNVSKTTFKLFRPRQNRVKIYPNATIHCSYTKQLHPSSKIGSWFYKSCHDFIKINNNIHFLF